MFFMAPNRADQPRATTDRPQRCCIPRQCGSEMQAAMMAFVVFLRCKGAVVVSCPGCGCRQRSRSTGRSAVLSGSVRQRIKPDWREHRFKRGVVNRACRFGYIAVPS